MVSLSSRLTNISLTLLLVLCPSFFLSAQPETFRFQHLTIDDGLSQNLIYCIEQDDEGFLWFGTNDGLNRYDGYEFSVYKHRPADATSLLDNSVTALLEDSRGDLWVGAGGLNRYDRRYDRFERIMEADDLPGNLAVLQIQDLKEDHNGDLWVAVKNAGLYRLIMPGADVECSPGSRIIDPDRGYRLMGPYDLPAGEEGPSLQGDIKCLKSVGRSLWVTMENGVCRLIADDAGCFPAADKAVFQILTFDVAEGITYFDYLFQEENGPLWIGTSRGPVRVPDPELPGAYEFFPYPEGFFSLIWSGIPQKMEMDESGRLWIATFEGLAIFDPATGSFQHLLSNPDDENGLSFNNIPDIFIDRGNVIWLATAGMGIDKYLGSGKAFKNYLDKRRYKTVYSIYGLVEDNKGSLWMAANSETLFRLERSSEKMLTVSPRAVPEWVVTGITKDGKGTIWITNDHLLVRLEPESGRQEAFEISKRTPLSFFPSDSVSAVYVDRQEEIWLCNTRVLRRFDPATGTFTAFPLPDLELEKVESFYRDEEGRFWIATLQGLLCYDIRDGNWQIYRADPDAPGSLRNNRLKSLLPDPVAPERYLWIGTGGGGLARLDMQEEVFQAYTSEDGLANDFIYGILADDAGRLWMSTNQGLSRFNPARKAFTNYKVEDGLQSNEFNSRAYHKSDGGELFFGGINGITAFFPEQINPNPHVPPVALTDMQLSYESIEPGKPGSPLEYTVGETETVRLEYDQNNIAFEFTALDFALPEKNRYQYMLEDFDATWINAGSDRRATYTNLPPGKYTFRVQGANNDGVWNEEGTSIEVIIAQPPWKTAWAFLLYALLASAVGYAIYRYAEERRRMRDELRTRELEAQKLAELDRFKSQFFANISHEFRMPITLIQGRIEEVLQQINRPDLREKLFSVQRSGRQLLRLIEQLLDIARLESSKMETKQAPGDLVRFVRTLVSSLQSGAENKEVLLTFSADEETLISIFDPDALQKILQNLISNAIKFSSPGGNVAVTLTKPPISNDSGAGVRIQVIDNGIGIAEQDLPHVFERFYQAENNAAISDKGFGLGLALVKELVALLKGTIEVKSELGKGTTFTVDLPVSELVSSFSDVVAGPKLNPDLLKMEMAELDASEAAEYETGVVYQNWKEAAPELILVVEDHTELRDYITDLLKPEYKVIPAKNGEEGLKMARTHIPDLIISDVMMPHMDGYTLSEKLGADQRTSHIPLILLTARAETADRIRGLQLGADDYLIKPFDEEELKTRVRNLISKREELKAKYSQSILKGGVSNINDSLEDSFLKEVAATIETHLPDENFSVEILAKTVGMSSSQLYRKLRALTGLSPVQLIQQFKLERAAELLKQGHNVSEVAYMVGLRSPAYFSQLFKKHFGCSPKEYADSVKSGTSS